jgi:hypothetical protein
MISSGTEQGRSLSDAHIIGQQRDPVAAATEVQKVDGVELPRF